MTSSLENFCPILSNKKNLENQEKCLECLEVEKDWDIDRLLQDLNTLKEYVEGKKLTDREICWLRLLLKEQDTDEISNKFYLSKNTVKSDLSRTLYKYVNEITGKKINHPLTVSKHLKEIGYRKNPNNQDIYNQEENAVSVFESFSKYLDKLLVLFESGKLQKQIVGSSELKEQFIKFTEAYKQLDIYILKLQSIDQYKPVSSVQPSINLTEWLQNRFTEAEQALWLKVEEIFPRKSLAFRKASVQRAKKIQLGNLTITLILDLELTDNKGIRVLLGLYPLESQTKLPKNITTIVIDFNQETLVEISTENYPDGFIQELLLDSEESFTVEISYDNFSHRENFIV